MKTIIDSPGVRIISIFTLLLIMINISFADDLYPRGSEGKKYDKQSKWSFSFYAAMAFGGPGDQINNQMRISGFDDSYMSYSGSSKYFFLSRIRPRSWMIQVDYRLTKVLGTGLLYSNSHLGEINGHKVVFAGFDGLIGNRIRVRTISILLSIYLNDYIIFGIGPTYNMTDFPSNSNKMGYLAHLNIRIPLSESFSISGICQYRYIGGTTIGPYTRESTDDDLTPKVSTNSYVFPATEISYSHLFIGIGIGIHFIKK
jgi:hypothetical protein